MQRNAGTPPSEKGVTHEEKNFYSPPLPFTYKVKKTEKRNDVTEWVFRDYRGYLKKLKGPLPPRYDVVEFDMRTNANELDKNLKLELCFCEFQDKVK